MLLFVRNFRYFYQAILSSLWMEWPFNEVNYKGIYLLGFQNMIVDRTNGVAALTEFSCKKMYEYFAGPKTSDRNNKVTIRRGSTLKYFLISEPVRTGIMKHRAWRVFKSLRKSE